LCGEYAVLDGAPAISAAVDRRARVTVRETGGAQIIVNTLGFADGAHSYRAAGPGLEAVGDRTHLPLFEAAWTAAEVGAQSGLVLELDTAAFLAGDVKLGLGSSAALTAALVKALTTWCGNKTDADALCRQVHSNLQHGRGSGVDVATSCAGGLIRFQRERTGNPYGQGEEHISVAGIDWPKGLHAAVLFSGVAASTPEKLQRLESRPRQAVSNRLTETATEAAAAWQRGTVTEVLDATAGFVGVLADFSATYALDVFGGGHAALLELAARQRLVYKPCGAGGGDVGVVLGDSAKRIEEFVERSLDMGFKPLDLDLSRPDVEGLTVEWMHD
jgi:phosphomevalonate kinase